MSITVRIMEEDGLGRMQTRPIGFDDGTGHVTGVSEADPLPVSIAGGVTLNGDISASTEYTEDAALPGDPVGGALLARRRDTLIASEVSAEGDAIAVNATAKGELCVSDAAAIAGLASILAKVSADPATQTTLAAVLAKLSSDPATQTTLAAVLAKLSSDPATQTTLAAILAKLSSDPATQTTLAAILAHLPASLAANGGLKIEGVASGVAVPVSAAALPLPTGAATETSLAAVSTGIGALTESAPASDTASSGVNGRLQRIAQRLSSLIGLVPTALGANGGFKIEGVASGTAVPVSAASLPLPSGAATSAAQGTGNTSLASIVTALAGTLAVSAASLPLPTGAATAAKQDTGNTSLASIVSALAGTLAVSAASLPLPSGASTSAAQGTGNTSLASIVTALAGTLAVAQLPATSTYRLLSAAATDNATNFKASAGVLTTITGYNAAAALRWLKLYDKSTAPSSSDTPRKTIPLPAGTAFAFDFEDAFTSGIGFRLTVNGSDADGTSLTAADVVGLSFDYR